MASISATLNCEKALLTILAIIFKYCRHASLGCKRKTAMVQIGVGVKLEETEGKRWRMEGDEHTELETEKRETAGTPGSIGHIFRCTLNMLLLPLCDMNNTRNFQMTMHMHGQEFWTLLPWLIWKSQIKDSCSPDTAHGMHTSRLQYVFSQFFTAMLSYLHT